MEEAAITRAAFAQLLGVKPSYVTQLAKDDRLVLDAAGRVLPEASRARIVATKDPAKSAVAAHHAAARAPAATEGAGQGEGAAQAPAQAAADPDASYQDWRTRNERAKALSAERELAVEMGELLRADEVRGAIADAFTATRARLEALPDLLAPELAVIREESAIRARLTDEIEGVLAEASRHLASLGTTA